MRSTIAAVVVFGVLVACGSVAARDMTKEELEKYGCTETGQTTVEVDGRGRNGPLLASMLADLTDYVADPNGIQKTQLKVIPGMGVGVVATEPIEKGEPYLTVPIEKCIGYADMIASEGAGAALTELERRNGRAVDIMMKLFLMYEKFVNPNTRYRAFFNSLPTTFSTPLFFEADEVEALEGSLLHGVVESERGEVSTTYRALKRRAMDAYPDVFPAEVLTLERYIWAHAVFASRQIYVQDFPGESRLHLIPYVDMINCKEQADGTQDRTYTGYDSTRNAIVMHADESYAPGEQIFETYGNKSNRELLQYNGFVYEDNPNDCVYVRVESLYKEHYLTLPKMVKAAGFRTRFDECVPSSGVTPRLWTWVNIHSATETELRRNVGKTKDKIARHIWEKPTRARARKLLYSIYEEHYNKYPTTEEEDLALLASDENMTVNMRNAIRFRYEEKRTLRKLMDGLKNKVKGKKADSGGGEGGGGASVGGEGGHDEL